MHGLLSIQRDMIVLLCQFNRGSVLNMVGEDTFTGLADTCIYNQSSKIKQPEIVQGPNRKRRKEQKLP